MSPSATIRFQARSVLKGNYVAAVSAFVILLLPLFIQYGLTAVIGSLLTELTQDDMILAILEISILTPIAIIVYVLFSPLLTGYFRLFYRSALTDEFDMNDLFCYFSKNKYHKTLLLNLSFAVRMMLPCLIFYLPVILFYGICGAYMPYFVNTTLYFDAAFILTVLSTAILVIYSLKYFTVFALYCENEQAEIRDLFRTSKEIMRHHGQSATGLVFSFTPWMLLCLTILPILYVVPYMTQSLSIAAKWMIRTDTERKTI